MKLYHDVSVNLVRGDHQYSRMIRIASITRQELTESRIIEALLTWWKGLENQEYAENFVIPTQLGGDPSPPIIVIPC